MKKAILYIFSGLPASGKTTISRLFAKHIKAAYIRIDTVEQGLRDLCDFKVEGEGYRLSYRLACDNLALGLNVVADSCNPITLTRNEWQQVASDAGAEYVNIEVVCSNEIEHRYRVEHRVSSIKNLILPTWPHVQNREYEIWTSPVIQIDTYNKTPDLSLKELLEKLGDGC